ncbi:MAG: DUF3048 domain-containing protein [Dethiobacter sp.]|nr:DUF3048 domain-containing protein [Dethiobacter sp.]MBS3902358.1 DUF3048 domain-containing protein [Dethiobacter sp.]
MSQMKKLTGLLIVLLLISLGFSGRVSGNVPDPQHRIERTRTEISELEKVIKAMDADIKAREARLQELDAEQAKVKRLLLQTEASLAESEVRMAEKSRVLAGRLRSVYMKGGLSYLEMLLGADNLGDLLIRTAYLRRVLNRDADIIAAYRAEFDALAERRVAIAAQRKQIEDMRFEAEAQSQNLLAQRREQDALLKRARTQLAADLAVITPRAEKRPIYGVVIDNAGPARPQHGLSQASVIYEYEVEGRITRYLALFSALPRKVGPVRSAREHSIILAMENRVHYIYSGGSFDVLAIINNWNVRGTNATTSRGGSFFRDSARRAPHNLYVNLAALGAVAPSREVVIRPSFLSRQGEQALSIALEYANNLNIRYEFVQRQGAYRRYINGQVHRDAEGRTIMARNIIIQYVPHRSGLMGRPTPDIIGSGPIEFYALGQRHRGTWRKEGREAPTRFYFEDGQEIERIYGQTWVQLVRAR